MAKLLLVDDNALLLELMETVLSIDGQHYRSPDIVKLPRGQGDFKLTIKKPGYQPQEVLSVEGPASGQ